MHSITVLAAVILLASVALCSQYKLVCYVSSWAQDRPGVTRFTPDRADPFLCTHIIFTFAGVDENYSMTALGPGNEPQYRSLNALKERNPALKTLLAVGGWDSNNNWFTKMSGKHSRRAAFVDSVPGFLRSNGFDGLDVVWQNPGVFRGKHSGKKHFTYLLKELRAAFEEEALVSGEDKLLLSAAVSGLEEYARATYNSHTFPQYVDFISLMTYDFHGPWQGVTGHISPLYSRPHDSEDQYLSIDHAVKYWLSQGVEARKLILGFPAYSRTFRLTDRRRRGVGVPAEEGQAGKYTKTPGFMAAYEVCQFIMRGALVKWDRKQKVPYALKGNQWVAFDNGHSLRKKTKWLRHLGLGGAMVWSLDLDDFTGSFCDYGTFPFIRLLKKSLLSRHLHTPCPEQEQVR